MIRLFTAALVVGGVLATFHSTTNAATIVNGSFEDTSGMIDFTSNFDGVPVGWSFSGNQVQVLKSPPFAPSGVDGENYVEMYNTADLGTLSQDVNGLIFGQEYELSFLWGNRTSAFDITVEMGGTSFNASGSGLVNMTSASLIFTVANTIETLSITWNDPGDYGVSGALDAFRISAVPLPAGVWLLLSALGGLGFAGWRRKVATS